MKFSLASKTILIVDDYAAMRKAIRDMLYTLGAENISEADNGINAINAMAKTNFDIVLCDNNLGVGKTGQQVLEEARARKLISYQCVFVIVSAEQATSMVLGAMDGKPDEYLTKPFNAQQLFSRLQRNFARKDYMACVEKHIARGNLPKAIENCDILLAAGDKKMQTNLMKLRAELAINIGDFETAERIYHEVLANRELPWAKLGLGIIEFQQNRLELAVAIFEQMVKDHPLMMEGYDWLSKAYEALNKLPEVQAVLHHAVDLSPQSILRQKKLALTAEKNGSLDVAETAYRATLQLGKHSIYRSCSDFSGLAKLYSKTEANDKALKTLELMRREFADSAEAQLRSATLEAEVYKKTGHEELSAKALEKVLGFQSRLGNKIPKDLQLDIVKACFLSDQAKQAEEILYELIKTHVDDEAFLNDMRRMQAGIGMDNHSELLIRKIKQKLIATNNKGVELFKEGKIQEALELFDEAIAEMPDNKTIIMNMLKIIVHDLKTGQVVEEKLQRAGALFKKAAQLGVEPQKIAALKWSLPANLLNG